MSENFSLPSKLIDIHNHVRMDPIGSTADADPGGDKLIANMDGLNVERTLIMGVTYGHNQSTLAAVKKHPQRFVGGVFADPRNGRRAIDEVRKYHAEGFRFVKLFPNFGYYPDDEQFRPFFEAAAQLKMAVLSHCGYLYPGPGTAAYYSNPGRFEKLMRAYPDMPFIMATWAASTPSCRLSCSPRVSPMPMPISRRGRARGFSTSHPQWSPQSPPTNSCGVRTAMAASLTSSRQTAPP